jgi:hypothetical protein
LLLAASPKLLSLLLMLLPLLLLPLRLLLPLHPLLMQSPLKLLLQLLLLATRSNSWRSSQKADLRVGFLFFWVTFCNEIVPRSR